MRLFLAGFLLFLLTASGFAQTRTFSDDNFTVDLPAGYTERGPDAAGDILSALSADQNRGVLVQVHVGRYLRADDPTFKDRITPGFNKAGVTVLESSIKEINGFPFFVCTVFLKEGHKAIYMLTSADDRLYSLAYVSSAPEGPDFNDPDCQAFVNSFHYINTPVSYSYVKDRAATDVLGKVLWVLIVLGIIWTSASRAMTRANGAESSQGCGCVSMVIIILVACRVILILYDFRPRPETTQPLPDFNQIPTQAPPTPVPTPAPPPVIASTPSLSLVPVPTLAPTPVPTPQQGWVAPPANTIYPSEWKTTDGKTYKNVQVVKVEPDRVTISYDEGDTCMVPIDTLPLDIKKLLNYDPVEAGKAAAQHFLDDLNDKVDNGK
jgi:hypothetical protein